MRGCAAICGSLSSLSNKTSNNVVLPPPPSGTSTIWQSCTRPVTTGWRQPTPSSCMQSCCSGAVPCRNRREPSPARAARRGRRRSTTKSSPSSTRERWACSPQCPDSVLWMVLFHVNCRCLCSILQLWECGIQQCKAIASQLETVTYNFEKLSEIHVSWLLTYIVRILQVRFFLIVVPFSHL